MSKGLHFITIVPFKMMSLDTPLLSALCVNMRQSLNASLLVFRY